MTKIHLKDSYSLEEIVQSTSEDSSESLSKEDTLRAIKQVQFLLGKIYGLPAEAIAPEFFDFLKIVSAGAKKYVMNNWLRSDGKRSSEKAMHDSMFHHLAESFAKVESKYIPEQNVRGLSYPVDKDSGESPLLHLVCRGLMLYVRRERGIIHDEDKVV